MLWRQAPGGGGYLLKIARRNLWRNKKRTFLTAGGIAFAILLVNFASGMQAGLYPQMIATATSLYVGHINIQSAEFIDKNRLENTLEDPQAIIAAVERVPGVTAVTRRVETFALVSVGERSFGAQLVGMDLERERHVSKILETVVEGTAPTGADSALVGTALARNLGARIGDEVVVLGSAKGGGVAALAFTISGFFSTGNREMDRGLLIAPLAAVQDGYGLGSEAHTVVVRADDPDAVNDTVAGIRAAVDPLAAGGVVRGWPELLPEVVQAIEVDRISGAIFYWLIMGLVAFSIVNTFIMTVFERTREFGVLLAVGMRARQVFAMLLLEASYLWLLGAVIGVAIASAVVGWLAAVGIPLGDLEGLGQQMYIQDRMYADFSVRSVLFAPAVLLVGTWIAALIPGVRLFRLKPVEALRET